MSKRQSARGGLACALVLWTAGAAGTARAQGVDRRYVEEPTGGIALPTAPLAGELDGRAVATNPGGLPLVRGTELALALSVEDPDVATSAGQGFGAFVAMSGGGGLLPRFGLGLGLEWLRPSRSQLDPDPGEPFRFTLGLGAAVGRSSGIGASWHHLSGGAAAGTEAFDLGASTRWGNWLALGAALRDVSTGSVAGAPVQRRYELEAAVRPLGTDRLEVAAGGRLGETRLDVDGWGRLSARVARGVFAHAAIETRALHGFEDSATGTREIEGRDVRATLGLELSFGTAGVAMLGTGLRDDRGGRHLLGGQLAVRLSSLGPASVLPPPQHLERIELSGTIDIREVTSHVARLRAIARDPTAAGVVVTFDDATSGWATLQELRDELLALRKAGKKVFAYLVSATGRDYFVASAADKIYMDPAGALRLVGIAGTTLYLRGLFDQVGVAPQFEKIAEYKSAPEQLIERGPTEPAARMMNELYDSIWEQWLAQVAAARRIDKEALRALVDRGPYTAGDVAADQKLIDAVATPEKISELIAKELGGPLPLARPPRARPDRWQRPGIAIIYVDGDIIDGKSRTVPLLGQQRAGSESLVAAIAAARASERVGAIILRIDSPGGSALASELIAREVFATRGAKPILCSMGDVAASGGYFVAAGCETIFAEPMTITGSIGIFYGKFDVSGLLGRLGITTDTYKRGKRADVESYFRPYTEEERGVLLDKLKYMYGRFVGAVAEGRRMKKEEVDAVGRGHVWSGERARQVRLVDRFGGLGDAIDLAKERMGLSRGTQVQLYELPGTPESLLGRVGKLIGVRADAAPAASLEDLPVLRDLVRGLAPSLLVAPAAPQARLPFELTWE
ncbi:MAG TPA: signal peptide peptidase SppA [Kofleriaceae bacterium]|nr:signal peptide peptidase SppA [Kofleriaceae bacterium]